MRKTKALTGLLLVSLVVSCAGVIVYQQSMIRQLLVQLYDTIPVSDGRDWGATFTMTTYRGGVFLSSESYHNVITNAARSALRGHIGNSTLAVWRYLAIGTGSGGGASSTTLVTEFSRYQGTYAIVGSYNFTITFTWTPGNFSGQTITEVGVLNDATVGILLNYDDSFSRGPLLGTDTLEVIVNFQIGS